MALRLDYAGHKPYQAHGGDAGLDLFSREEHLLLDNQVTKVGTGTRLAIPKGFFGMLVARSSFGSKGITLANGIGIIDSGYRGEIIAAIRNQSGGPFRISEGERIAQIIVVPFAQVALHEVQVFDMTERGEGGFGSSGKA